MKINGSTKQTASNLLIHKIKYKKTRSIINSSKIPTRYNKNEKRGNTKI